MSGTSQRTAEITARLRKRSNQLMPEWAHAASSYWYDHGGRQDRDDARLLREAADQLEAITTRLEDSGEGT